jgi:hypothetical protein
MLYGSSTGIVFPGAPVFGLIAVSELPRSFVTYSVLRSHAGTTCCGSVPTLKCRTTLNERWSITSTVPLSLFGT